MKFMPVRAFLRGGYQHIDDVTVVLSHGHPIFTVFPGEPRFAKEAARFRTETARDSIPPGPPGPSPNGG